MLENSSSLPFIDLSLVTYNSEKWMPVFFESLLKQSYPLEKINIYITDNGSVDKTIEYCEEFLKNHGTKFSNINIFQSKNLGFCVGHNSNIFKGKSSYILVSNVDLEFEENSIYTIVLTACHDCADVASWEFRQKPYEHPKYYSPVTLETAWSSSACILFKREAFEKMGGYEERIFLYGDDVEISYRLRDYSYKLKYCPKAVCWHYTYESAHQIKPTQYFGSSLSNIYIRLRYGSILKIISGILIYLVLFFIPKRSIKNRIKKLAINFIKILYNAPYFLKTRKKNNFYFPINGLNYEFIRGGAFYPSLKGRDSCAKQISIIIRTYKGRINWLKEAVTSVLNQTYKNIQIIIIEDGSNTAENYITDIKARHPTINIVYKSISKVGRCIAGNTGLKLATGEYIGFLDDDDLFFSDHIETLAGELECNASVSGVYALAFEVSTKILSEDNWQYKEKRYEMSERQEFSRIVLHHHNYIPIQAALFKRELYDNYGGFDTELTYLEDWDLWIRYTLKHDFAFINKTTSLYRVPFTAGAKLARIKLFYTYRDKMLSKYKDIFSVALEPAKVNKFREKIKKIVLTTYFGSICFRLLFDIYKNINRIFRRLRKVF